MVKSCLFDAGTVSLRPYLKRGDDIGLEQILSEVVRMKPRGHSLTPLHSDNVAFRMSEIGG
jgi:molybdenum cofactor biosynthesis enzyme MoaA